jgi:hypothetical protein
MLTVNIPPGVIANPANQAVCLGGSVSFTATATGNPAPTVQWQVSANGGATFLNVPDATNSTYTFATSASDNAKQYRAQFTNLCGVATSAAATLTINELPTAVVGGGGVICPGSSANVQATLGGLGPWTLIWSDGFTQANVTASPATRSVNPTSTTSYSVATVNDAHCSNSGSGSATVTLNTLPVVTANPANKAVCAGGSASFSAAATGSPTPTIQWQVSTNGGETFLNVANATSSTYAFATTGGDNAKQFRAQFSNACGVAASTAAALTVNALPTCSISGADLACANSLNNLYSGPAGLAAYRWSVTGSATLSGPATAQSVSVNAGASGTFTLTLALTNASGCSSTCSKSVTIAALPTAVVSGSGAICPGNSANIQATLSGTGPWTLLWSDGFTQANVAASPVTRSVSPTSTTSYSVTTVTDAHCSNSGSGSATVTVNTLPTVTANPANQAVCAGASASVTATRPRPSSGRSARTAGRPS